MTPSEFKRAWEGDGDQLVKFPPEIVRAIHIPEYQQAFLIEPGLPVSAAPFLDFGGPPHYLALPTAAQLWHAGDAFLHYRIIGANGFGDPVCIDEQSQGNIVYLNHDNEMRRGFMNSSVEKLAFTLLAFREIVRETQRLGGRDAYSNGKIPAELVDKFIISMDEIDPPAIKMDTFWFNTITGEGI